MHVKIEALEIEKKNGMFDKIKFLKSEYKTMLEKNNVMTLEIMISK